MGQGVTLNRSVYLGLIVLILFGCKVEHIKSDYLCFNWFSVESLLMER